MNERVEARAIARTGIVPGIAGGAKKRRIKEGFGVLALALVVTAALTVLILVPLRGWEYYSTPLAMRGYLPEHTILRPSGTLGLWLGIVGATMMTISLLYSLQKKVKPVAKLGTPKGWLAFHICCGLLGPVLVTFHTAFKFSGVVSVAYWSMVLVVLSGFVGRYLYVRIPKTLRGTEATFAEVEAQAAELKAQYAESHPSAAVLLKLDAFEHSVIPAARTGSGFLNMVFGETALLIKVAALRREMLRAGVDRTVVEDVLAATTQRALLLRRISYLQKTKRAFDLWHVFHRPLVYVLFIIMAAHIGAAVYFGYAVWLR